MNYLKDNIRMYLNSFKRMNKSFLLILTLNALFVMLTLAVFKVISLFSKGWMDKINKIDLSGITLQTEAQLQSTISALKGFVVFVIFAAVLFILLFTIIWSLTQGTIWNLLLKNKFTLKYFERFLLLNLIWFLPWLIMLFLILFGSKLTSLTAISYIFIALFLHFSFILYVLFAKENKLKQIKNALKLGIIKIHKFVLPYLIILITFIVILQLNLLKINYYLIVFVFLIFFSWVQAYTKEVIIESIKT